MMEALQDTKLYGKLLASVANVDEDFAAFWNRFSDLWDSHDPPIVVLRSHLIVEYFLTRYLAAANPAIREWDQAQLRFLQKVALSDHPASVVSDLVPALRCLNKLRNRVAHDLRVSLDAKDVAEIHDFMLAWEGASGQPVAEGTALIEQFAKLACSWIDGTTCAIGRHGGGHGFTGLISWYAEGSEGGDKKPEEK